MLKQRWNKRAITALIKDEDGTASVETVIWIPVFMFIFALIADVALIFGGEARILRVTQDANRAMSIGRVRSIQDTQSNIKAMIAGLAPNAVVTTTFVSGLISTSVVLPATDLTSVGLVDSILSLKLRVTAQHLAEG